MSVMASQPPTTRLFVLQLLPANKKETPNSHILAPGEYTNDQWIVERVSMQWLYDNSAPALTTGKYYVGTNVKNPIKVFCSNDFTQM